MSIAKYISGASTVKFPEASFFEKIGASGERMRVLFVCYENICRSPMAEGVFRHLADMSGYGTCFEVASAGTVSYQAGSLPDPRAVRAAARHGIDITWIRARHIEDVVPESFDLLFAMDRENHEALLSLLPHEAAYRIRMMTGCLPEEAGSEIADPYYGGQEEFDRTFLRLMHCAETILAAIGSDCGYRLNTCH